MKPSPPAPIPIERVAKFVRQLTHDIRNGLSAIDLEAAFVAELVEDPEASEEIRKLRRMVANTAKTLREVSQHFQPITLHPMPWEASMFLDELTRRLHSAFPEEKGWEVENTLRAHPCIDIDLEQMLVALVHVMRNAFQFRSEGDPVRLVAREEGETVILELHEVKNEATATAPGAVPPEEWGLQPLQNGRGSGYGLGLYRARNILLQHGGTLQCAFEGEELITRMTIPLCEETMETR